MSAALPRADPAARLAPRRRFGAMARSRRLRIAVAAAVLLHVLAGIALFVHPPGIGLPPGASEPRQATIEMIQNAMPTTGDQPTGGVGETNAARDATAAPPSAAPPPAAPAAPAPTLARAPDGELPPFQPEQAPPAPPAPQTPPAQTTAEQVQPADTADIRLSTMDDQQGAAGGTADTQAVPDPSHRNKLPAYPRVAAEGRQQGEVDMIVHVAPDGSAAEVVVANSSGSTSLDEAALRAVRRWRFKAAVAGGRAVASDVPVRLNFVLR